MPNFSGRFHSGVDKRFADHRKNWIGRPKIKN
jgi:hypothetical protein